MGFYFLFFHNIFFSFLAKFFLRKDFWLPLSHSSTSVHIGGWSNTLLRGFDVKPKTPPGIYAALPFPPSSSSNSLSFALTNCAVMPFFFPLVVQTAFHADRFRWQMPVPWAFRGGGLLCRACASSERVEPCWNDPGTHPAQGRIRQWLPCPPSEELLDNSCRSGEPRQPQPTHRHHLLL